MKSSPQLKPAVSLSSADYLTQRLKEAYLSFDSAEMAQVESLYTDDVYFEDPSQAVQGKSELIRYLQKKLRGTARCGFKFHSTMNDGADVFLTWTMFLNHPKLSRGETVRIEGSSNLKTRNGKIYYQRDYFDMSAILDEKSLVFVKITRSLKKRLS